jgi:hypothetical protein
MESPSPSAPSTVSPSGTPGCASVRSGSAGLEAIRTWCARTPPTEGNAGCVAPVLHRAHQRVQRFEVGASAPSCLLVADGCLLVGPPREASIIVPVRRVVTHRHDGCGAVCRHTSHSTRGSTLPGAASAARDERASPLWRPRRVLRTTRRSLPRPASRYCIQRKGETRLRAGRDRPRALSHGYSSHYEAP